MLVPAGAQRSPGPKRRRRSSRRPRRFPFHPANRAEADQTPGRAFQQRFRRRLCSDPNYTEANRQDQHEGQQRRMRDYSVPLEPIAGQTEEGHVSQRRQTRDAERPFFPAAGAMLEEFDHQPADGLGRRQDNQRGDDLLDRIFPIPEAERQQSRQRRDHRETADPDRNLGYRIHCAGTMTDDPIRQLPVNRRLAMSPKEHDQQGHAGQFQKKHHQGPHQVGRVMSAA